MGEGPRATIYGSVCEEGAICGGESSEDVRGRRAAEKTLFSDVDGECLAFWFEGPGIRSREPAGAEVERFEGGDIARLEEDEDIS